MTRDEAIAWQERLAAPERGSCLPEICLYLRAGANRSCPLWTAEEIAECVDMLEARLDTWQPSHLAADAEFDAAVRHLVACTIRNVRAYPWWMMKTVKA